MSEEPGNGSPAQTSAKTSESYYPEVREEGEIPSHYLDTTNGHLPSFFYAPRIDVLGAVGLRAVGSATIGLDQLKSMFRDFDKAPTLLVRDNVAGVNHLYNGGPYIYRYHDTCEPWHYGYREHGREQAERGWQGCWSLKSTNSQDNEVACGSKAEANTQTDVPKSSNSATTTFQRVM